MDQLISRSLADRATAPEARRVAYAEAGFAVVNDRPDAWTRHLNHARLVQERGTGGTYSYWMSSDYTPEHYRYTARYDQADALLALFGKLLAPQMAGLPPRKEAKERERIQRQVEEAMRGYLDWEGDWPSSHRSSASQRKSKLKALLADLEVRARARLEERWPAVQAVAEALLQKESGLSGEGFRKTVDQAPVGGGWDQVLDGVASVGAVHGQGDGCGSTGSPER